MDIVTATVVSTLGGAFIGAVIGAAVSVWVASRGKSDPHRAALYQKQMEAYSEIFTAWMEFSFLLRNSTDNEERAASFTKLTNLMGSYSWVLPMRLVDELSKHFDRALGIGKDNSQESIEKFIQEINTGFLYAIDVAREELGIEPLNQETLKIFKQLKP